MDVRGRATIAVSPQLSALSFQPASSVRRSGEMICKGLFSSGPKGQSFLRALFRDLKAPAPSAMRGGGRSNFSVRRSGEIICKGLFSSGPKGQSFLRALFRDLKVPAPSVKNCLSAPVPSANCGAVGEWAVWTSSPRVCSHYWGGWRSAPVRKDRAPATPRERKSSQTRQRTKGCGGSTVEDDNKVWLDFLRNPSGRGQFSRFRCRSSLTDTRYVSLLASRTRKNWLPAPPPE